MVLCKTKAGGGFIVYIVPMCCLDSTSNKEHTFKVIRGGGRLFDGAPWSGKYVFCIMLEQDAAALAESLVLLW